MAKRLKEYKSLVNFIKKNQCYVIDNNRFFVMPAMKSRHIHHTMEQEI